MTADTETLRRIPDEKPVRVFLPIKQRNQRYRTQAVYRQRKAPSFSLLFSAGTLPLNALDQTAHCLVCIDMGGPNITLEADIARASAQSLEMIARKTLSHEQMREFFRVDAVTQVISKSFQPEFFGAAGEAWSIRGKTLDISGSGILATFPEKPPEDGQVRLEITVPFGSVETVKSIARPVRSTRIDDDQWDVAYQFVDITSEDRDRIIGCCLEIQRRLLRLKVDLPVS